ncbi:hypothetical protein [Actinomadura sp. 21ATH]|uniref:hypothetical protein n=1 Tax=Actinomadura sp. 21ATH TaxID=1735444 RepID=UPI0035C0F1C9
MVSNPDDDVAVTHYLATIHDLDQGRIVVSPRVPGSPRSSLAAARHRLGADMLAALGKEPLTGSIAKAPALALALAWMRGERVGDLVVDRAHALPEELLRELAALTQDAHIRLWLVWIGAPPPRLRLSAGKPVKITAKQLRDALPVIPAPAQQPRPPAWPALPITDFPVFMEVCRARIADADFARVAEVFDLARAAAARFAADYGIGVRIGTPQLNLLRTEAWLRDEMLTADHHPAQLLVTLRAAQVGLFHHNLLLRWRPNRLPHPAEAHLGTQLTDAVIRRLRRLCAPAEAAALALRLHLAADLNALQIRHLSPDGATVTQMAPEYDRVAVVEHRFPRTAQGILSAHLAHRLESGAGEDAPLFPRVPPHPDHETLRIRFGLPMLDTIPAATADPTATTPWLAQRGLSLHRLEPYRLTDKYRNSDQ